MALGHLVAAAFVLGELVYRGEDRTVCGCQPVERVTVAMVAPLGPHSSASTRACFEFARPLG